MIIGTVMSFGLSTVAVAVVVGLMCAEPAVADPQNAIGKKLDGNRQVAEKEEKALPPFLGNFLIEDTCQFQLCGPSYGSEWGGGGSAPQAGSCSGDCSLLAITLNANKFHKEFLWSSCARMCGSKHPADRQPEYKSRFLCMEGCYKAYALVAPHHNIARYCMQAACSNLPQDTYQVDCFESCARHVSSSLPETTWKVWAKAIAANCSALAKQTQPINQRLSCADAAVWEHLSTVEQRTEERLANHCLQVLCSGQLKCGVACLNHIHSLQENQRSEWSDCSQSAECQGSGGEWHAKQACSDTCLSSRQEERERQRLLTLKSESQSRLQLQYSASHSHPANCPGTALLLLPALTFLTFFLPSPGPL